MALCGENRQLLSDYLTESVPNLDTSVPTTHQRSGPRWFKQWVECDTVLNPGKLMLLKWVNGDILKSYKVNPPEVPKEPEDEYELLYLCKHEGCGKAFTEQSALRKHMNIHGERQYVCHYEGCGKRFMDSSKLKRHFLIHTGERHFVCPVDGCGKAFSLDFNLRSHMRTHTQENYHVCPFEDCGKRYAHEYKLRAHLRQYHEKVLPPDVKLGPPPPLPPSLEKEIKMQKSAVAAAAAAASANVQRPFACPHRGCGKRYIHEYKLNLHLRKEHANDSHVEATRPAWNADAEDDMDEGTERQLIRSARGKTRLISKVVTPKAVKNKWPKVDSSPRMQTGYYPDMQQDVMRKSFHADSDDSDDEYQDSDDDDDNIERMMNVRTAYRDDYGDESDEDDED